MGPAFITAVLLGFALSPFLRGSEHNRSRNKNGPTDIGCQVRKKTELEDHPVVEVCQQGAETYILVKTCKVCVKITGTLPVSFIFSTLSGDDQKKLSLFVSRPDDVGQKDKNADRRDGPVLCPKKLATSTEARESVPEQQQELPNPVPPVKSRQNLAAELATSSAYLLDGDNSSQKKVKDEHNVSQAPRAENLVPATEAFQSVPDQQKELPHSAPPVRSDHGFAVDSNSSSAVSTPDENSSEEKTNVDLKVNKAPGPKKLAPSVDAGESVPEQQLPNSAPPVRSDHDFAADSNSSSAVSTPEENSSEEKTNVDLKVNKVPGPKKLAPSVDVGESVLEQQLPNSAPPVRSDHGFAADPTSSSAVSTSDENSSEEKTNVDLKVNKAPGPKKLAPSVDAGESVLEQQLPNSAPPVRSDHGFAADPTSSSAFRMDGENSSEKKANVDCNIGRPPRTENVAPSAEAWGSVPEKQQELLIRVSLEKLDQFFVPDPSPSSLVSSNSGSSSQKMATEREAVRPNPFGDGMSKSWNPIPVLDPSVDFSKLCSPQNSLAGNIGSVPEDVKRDSQEARTATRDVLKLAPGAPHLANDDAFKNANFDVSEDGRMDVMELVQFRAPEPSSIEATLREEGKSENVTVPSKPDVFPDPGRKETMESVVEKASVDIEQQDTAVHDVFPFDPDSQDVANEEAAKNGNHDDGDGDRREPRELVQFHTPEPRSFEATVRVEGESENETAADKQIEPLVHAHDGCKRTKPDESPVEDDIRARSDWQNESSAESTDVAAIERLAQENRVQSENNDEQEHEINGIECPFLAEASPPSNVVDVNNELRNRENFQGGENGDVVAEQQWGDFDGGNTSGEESSSGPEGAKTTDVEKQEDRVDKLAPATAEDEYVPVKDEDTINIEEMPGSGLPPCLNGHCSGFHWLRHCPNTSPAEKQRLREIFSKTKKEGRRQLRRRKKTWKKGTKSPPH